MAERRPSIKERLNRLEEELDELIRLQESVKEQQGNVNAPSARQYQAISVTTRSRMIRNHGSCCIHDPAASAPLTDISKFLQHINHNLSKGTQAIAKLATSTWQETGGKLDNRKPCNDQNLNKGEPPQDGTNVWRSALEKKNNDDGIFRELREEKDKRMRLENLVKGLKDEMKKTKNELQQKSESTIRLLQEELKDTSEKLKRAECEIKKLYEDNKSAECLWPLKYETASKELHNEKLRRKQAEENIMKLQDSLQKMFLETEEHLKLQKTASWLKNQNENLLCLAKKLRQENEVKDGDISEKNRFIEDNLRKIKQLTSVCGKLRDILVVTKEKFLNADEKLNLSMEHSQRLSEKNLQTQRRIEDLQKNLEEGKNECARLSELLRSLKTEKSSLYSRLEEVSEMSKKQNRLITRQADIIDTKDEQLKLAYENIKLQSHRLEDLESKVSGFQKAKDNQRNSILHGEYNRLQLELENEKENVMIRDKIIDSHLKTISENKSVLMKKDTEINQLKRELSDAERKMAIEITTNEELLAKVKQLQLRKEELKRRLNDLEKETLQSTKNAAKLEQIETQIQLKQKEWEESKIKLIAEKEEAFESLGHLSHKHAEYEQELERRDKTVKILQVQVQEKDNQIQEGKFEILRLNKELQEADERCRSVKKRLEESLQSACEVWKKTMQQLNL